MARVEEEILEKATELIYDQNQNSLSVLQTHLCDFIQDEPENIQLHVNSVYINYLVDGNGIIHTRNICLVLQS